MYTAKLDTETILQIAAVEFAEMGFEGMSSAHWLTSAR
jgi:hypothetical protein